MNRTTREAVERSIPVYAILRSDPTGTDWVDLGTVSHTPEGSADIADASPAPREWKAANRPLAVVPLTLTLAAGAKRLPIPNTPSRRAR